MPADAKVSEVPVSNFNKPVGAGSNIKVKANQSSDGSKSQNSNNPEGIQWCYVSGLGDRDFSRASE